MDRWEYLTYFVEVDPATQSWQVGDDTYDTIDDILDAAGSDGWELLTLRRG
jgi:hypothetical protein